MSLLSAQADPCPYIKLRVKHWIFADFGLFSDRLLSLNELSTFTHSWVLPHTEMGRPAVPCFYFSIKFHTLFPRSLYDTFQVKANSVSSVQFSRSVVSDSLPPHESQYTRPPCPSPTPRVHSDSCPSSQGCHPAISASVIPFSSCPQSLPASESSPMSQLFA